MYGGFPKLRVPFKRVIGSYRGYIGYYLGFRVQGVRFPKIRGTFLGVPIIRTIVFWCLYLGPPVLGNNHILQVSRYPVQRASLSPF